MQRGKEIQPFSDAALDEVVRDVAVLDERLADLVLVLARTGLRWSEARALASPGSSPPPTHHGC